MNKVVLLVLLFVSTSVNAVSEFPIFATVSKIYGRVSDATTVKNMPPIRSQDGLGICYGFSAWTVYQQYLCKKKGSSCNQLDDNTTVSPLALSVLGASSDYTKKQGGDSFPYSASGGNSIKALQYLSSLGGAENEACYPFDQFLIKHQNSSNKEMNAAFERLRSKYYDKKKTEGDICTDCLVKDLDSEFGLKVDNAKVLKSLNQNTFDKFLYELMFGNCQSVSETVPYKLNRWPENATDFKYEKFMEKIKGLFSNNTPVLVGGCIDSKDFKSCKKAHDFVISGYRKVCKSNNDCRETLRIQNSWGKDWQANNDDGWVDAKILFDYIEKDQNTVGWLS